MELCRVITKSNAAALVRDYTASAELVGACIEGLTSLELLHTLKRGVTGAGPYAQVSLFEAANRIITDLVILKGIAWLLSNNVFPFESYAVEYGHENNEAHDIRAAGDGKVLVGEAFNVAPSFFSTKKNAALKKLRNSAVSADYRIILCNADAVAAGYVPQAHTGEAFVFVDLSSGHGRIIPSIL